MTTPRIVVLGGGHGMAQVLLALRGIACELTAIVTVADDGGSSGELRRARGGPAVGDLRRSLVALTDERDSLGRAFTHQIDVAQLGRHSLGNLVILSVADAFGDLAEASRWLADRLGLRASVLPATAEPVTLLADAADGTLRGECAIGSATVPLHRLRFEPPRPAAHAQAAVAIADADLVLLAPGSLYTSVLAASTVPDIVDAIGRASAPVVWIANLERDRRGETSSMSAMDHVRALRDHGIALDALLYDPGAELSFGAAELARVGLKAIERPLRGGRRGIHDATLLGAALGEVVESRTG